MPFGYHIRNNTKCLASHIQRFKIEKKALISKRYFTFKNPDPLFSGQGQRLKTLTHSKAELRPRAEMTKEVRGSVGSGSGGGWEEREA